MNLSFKIWRTGRAHHTQCSTCTALCWTAAESFTRLNYFNERRGCISCISTSLIMITPSCFAWTAHSPISLVPVEAGMGTMLPPHCLEILSITEREWKKKAPRSNSRPNVARYRDISDHSVGKYMMENGMLLVSVNRSLHFHCCITAEMLVHVSLRSDL